MDIEYFLFMEAQENKESEANKINPFYIEEDKDEDEEH